MKIVYISPKYNGLYQYAKPFVQMLREKSKMNVFHLGFEDICFDNEKIYRSTTDIVDEICGIQPDLIHYNYGTYDAEQLLPYFLKEKLKKTKSILTVHSIQFDLFKKIKNTNYDIKANEFARKMDGYVFFTNYSRKILNIQNKPYCISFHPAIHGHISLKKKDEISILNNYSVNENKLFISLLGYASHWKSSIEFIKLAQEYKNTQFLIGGPFWLDKINKENHNIELGKIKNLIIIDKELNEKEILTFIRSSIGFFPYFFYKSFQGSGMLPNYLYHRRNCVVNDFEPLCEYADNTCIVDFKDYEKLKEAVDICMKKQYIKKNDKFSYNNHLKKIEGLYKRVLEG